MEKYNPALSKSESFWDNSYCVRLVIVSLDVNVGLFSDFWSFFVVICYRFIKDVEVNSR